MKLKSLGISDHAVILTEEIAKLLKEVQPEPMANRVGAEFTTATIRGIDKNALIPFNQQVKQIAGRFGTNSVLALFESNRPKTEETIYLSELMNLRNQYFSMDKIVVGTVNRKGTASTASTGIIKEHGTDLTKALPVLDLLCFYIQTDSVKMRTERQISVSLKPTMISLLNLINKNKANLPDQIGDIISHFYVEFLKDKHQIHAYTSSSDLIQSISNLKDRILNHINHHVLESGAKKRNAKDKDMDEQFLEIYSTCDKALLTIIDSLDPETARMFAVNFMSQLRSPNTMAIISSLDPTQVSYMQHELNKAKTLKGEGEDAFPACFLGKGDAITDIEPLGGRTYRVFKLRASSQDIIAKIIPVNAEENLNQKKQCKFKARLGELAPQIIGTIYGERLYYKVSAGSFTPEYRVEFSKFYSEGNMKQAIKRNTYGDISFEERVECILKLMKHTISLNKHDYVYTDFKLANVFIDNGSVVLADYNKAMIDIKEPNTRFSIDQVPITEGYITPRLRDVVKEGNITVPSIMELQNTTLAFTMLGIITGEEVFSRDCEFDWKKYPFFESQLGKIFKEVVKELLKEGEPYDVAPLHEQLNNALEAEFKKDKESVLSVRNNGLFSANNPLQRSNSRPGDQNHTFLLEI